MIGDIISLHSGNVYVMRYFTEFECKFPKTDCFELSSCYSSISLTGCYSQYVIKYNIYINIKYK